MTTLPLTISDGVSRNSDILSFVKSVVPQIFDACNSVDDISISVLSGGVTNQLYRVAKASDKSVSVVCRVFGKETERIISRDAELFWQSQFLKTFGRCQNGLVYEFLAGFKEMPPEDMLQYWKISARSMALFHVKASRAALLALPYATQKNFTTVSLTDWLTIASSEECTKAILQGGKTEAQIAAYKRINFEELAADCKLVLGEINKRVPRLPQGSCHNDLLGANIMVERDPSSDSGNKPVASALKEDSSDAEFDSSVRLIDFEYGHRNYLYYDIGNHFNEFGGLDGDWSKYPKDDLALEFIDKYLTSLKRATLSESTLAQEEGKPDLKQVLADVKLMSCASHLCWTSWSIIQGAFSVIEFDYFSYALQRYEGYQLMKKEIGL